MTIITASSLILATEVLRYRLINPSAIGTVILAPDKIATVNIDDCYGRFIGGFVKRSDSEPCFVLFARSDLNDSIRFLFVFYLNHRYTRIQPSELKLLKNHDVKDLWQSVINIHSSLPKTCNLSVLLQTVELYIHPNLMTDFELHQDIKVGKVSSLVCFNSSIESPKCDLSKPCSNTDKICSFMKDLNLKVVNYKGGKIANDFHILVVPYRRHLVYVINYIDARSMMIFLPHSNQFRCNEEADGFLSELKSKLSPYKPKYFGATRYYGNFDTHCNSREILKACVFCIVFGNNLMTVVKQSDIESVFSDDKIDGAVAETNRVLAESRPDELHEEYVNVTDDFEQNISSHLENNDDLKVTNIELDGDDGFAEVLSVKPKGNSSQSVKSSQETIIMTNEQLRTEFRQFINYDSYLDSIFPHTAEVEPRTDMEGKILNDRKMYPNALDVVCELWHRYTTVQLLRYFDSCEFQSEFVLEATDDDKRFVVIPIYNFNEIIIIIDKLRKEWVYLSPDNEAAKNHEVFKEIESIALEACKGLHGMKSWPIVITSHFHREYPRVHLIMSMFYIVKYFRYCSQLPKKVIYGEKAFRWYCYDVCMRLQLANDEYNEKNNLIKSNGKLKPDAYRNILIPIMPERSVVPLDQCPYCLKRGFSRIDQHIALKHGGQSEVKNKLRHPNE